MSQTVFYPNLNDFCRKYLDAHSPDVATSKQQFKTEYEAVQSSLFEHFLLFDKLCFKVYGENLPLAVLLNLFGVKGVEELVEQEAIEFVLSTQQIIYHVDDLPGLIPIGPMALNSGPHCDPEKSIELGYNWMRNKPLKFTRRRLTRKILAVCSVPDTSLAKTSVDMAVSLYNSGNIKSLNLAPEYKEITNLNRAEKQQFCSFATDLFDYSFLISRNLTSFANLRYFNLLHDTYTKVRSASDSAARFCTLAELEEIPNLNALFYQVNEPMRMLTSLRKKASSRKFRDWLAKTTSAENAHGIAKDYIDAICEGRSFFQSRPGRATKAVTMASIGAGIGALLDGGTGLAGMVLGPAAGVGLNLLDEFVINGLTKGWTPRIFFDDLRKLSSVRGKQ